VKLKDRDSLIKKKSFTNTGVVEAKVNTIEQEMSLFPPERLNRETIDLVSKDQATELRVI
jgi:hypothetical protein